MERDDTLRCRWTYADGFVADDRKFMGCPVSAVWILFHADYQALSATGVGFTWEMMLRLSSEVFWTTFLSLCMTYGGLSSALEERNSVTAGRSSLAYEAPLPVNRTTFGPVVPSTSPQIAPSEAKKGKSGHLIFSCIRKAYGLNCGHIYRAGLTILLFVPWQGPPLA